MVKGSKHHARNALEILEKYTPEERKHTGNIIMKDPTGRKI